MPETLDFMRVLTLINSQHSINFYKNIILKNEINREARRDYYDYPVEISKFQEPRNT